MKKKGFTLIELLAVIVILAVIALITVPILMGIIEKAKKNAFKDHVYGIMDSAHLYYADSLLKLEEAEQLEFSCNGEVCETDSGEKLKFKGSVPKSGRIILGSSGIEVYEITDGRYCASGNDKNLEISTDCITPSLEYITDGNIVRYDFDDDNNTSSTLNDLSGNNKNGTISGPVITDKGIFFDGNDHVKIGVINNPQITWEVSFSIQNFGTYYIMSNMESGGCAIYVQNKKIVGECHINGAYRKLIGAQELELNKFYTASITYDRNNFKLYLDSELQANYESSSGITVPNGSTIVMIGANPNGNNPETSSPDYFKGLISQARIYNRALSEDEIQNNYKIDVKKVKRIGDAVNNINKKFDNLIKDGLQLHYSVLNNMGLGYMNNVNYFADLSDNSYVGILHGPVFNEDGAYFDGSNDYISIGRLDNPYITWEVSFSIEKFGSYVILSNYENGGCNIDSQENKIGGGCYIDGAYRYLTSTQEIELNKFYTASITYDGNSFKLYLNGELQGSYESSSGIKNPTNSTIVMIGAGPMGSSPEPQAKYARYLKGIVNSVRIYNRALNNSEIKVNYNTDQKLYSN